LHGGGSLKEFYNEALDEVMEITAARYGAFVVFDSEGQIDVFVARGLSDKLVGRLVGFSIVKGVLKAAINETSALRVDNINEDSGSDFLVSDNACIKPLFVQPLLINDVMRGIIYLTDKKGGEPFTENDEFILNMVARDIVHVLYRNDLMQDLQKNIELREYTQSKLGKASAKLQYLVENTPSIIYRAVPSGDFSFTYISENIYRNLGYQSEDVLEDPDFWFQHIHSDDLDKIFPRISYLIQDGVQSYDYRFMHKDGSYIWMHDTMRMIFDSDNKPLEIVGSFTDITELKQAEEEINKSHKDLQEAQEQLLQSEKMSSIGQLAAGVAHEINNPIAFVYSNLSTMQKYTDKLLNVLKVYGKTESLLAQDNEVAKEIQQVREQADLDFLIEDLPGLVQESRNGLSRVKQIIQDLKDFSRVDHAELEFVDLHKGLDSTLNIASNEIKYIADVVKEYGDLPLVECRSAQINQVFMNLLVNAAHAIEEHGVITIRTGAKDDRVWVQITDTGNGISPEHMSKLFDPFFTTKPVGKGTGLGLSLSYGIVKTHDGRIEVESEVGRGTTFRVWLPVEQEDELDNETQASAIA
jgi:PAS domain S-box-containing protein